MVTTHLVRPKQTKQIEQSDKIDFRQYRGQECMVRQNGGLCPAYVWGTTEDGRLEIEVDNSDGKRIFLRPDDPGLQLPGIIRR